MTLLPTLLPRTLAALALPALALAALPAALAGPAAAQTALKLEGTCEKLVIAGEDLSADCSPVLMNTVSRNRTSFDFTARGGQSLSFSGTGAQQERTEETDPLQPINLIVPGKAGAAQSPAPAVGTCSFSTPAPGRTAITCEARSPGQEAAYAATFVTAAKAATDRAAPEKPAGAR